MARYQNTDIQVDSLNTKYPFTENSSCKLGTSILPAGSITGINISVSKPCIQLHISKISLNNNKISIQFKDTGFTVSYICTVIPDSQVCFIKNEFSCACGIMSYQKSFFNIMQAVLRQQTDKSLNFSKTNFCLLNQCLSCCAITGIQDLKINKQNSDYIQLTDNIIYTDPEGNISISVYGDVPASSTQSLKTINGQTLGKRHVVIKHRTLSNLRVLSDNGIQLAGVKDV